MKTRFFLHLLLSFFLFQACTKESTIDDNSLELSLRSEECKFNIPIDPQLPPNTDFTIRIDFKNTDKYYPFQYDILNGYVILGRLEMKNKNEANNISFTLFEVGDCNRYFVKKATYKGKDFLTNTHKIDFEIEALQKGEPREPINMDMDEQIIKINPGDLLNIKISSKDFPELGTHSINEGSETQGSLNSRLFPPFICQGQFTYGNGN